MRTVSSQPRLTDHPGEDRRTRPQADRRTARPGVRLSTLAGLAGLSISLVTTLFVVRATSADEVRLVSGNRIRGLILKETKKYWVVLVPEGIRAIDKAEVQDASRGDGVAVETPGGTPEPGGISAAPLAPIGRRLELVVSGEIDGEKLDNSDGLTVAYFEGFLKTCQPPLTLARENGGASGAGTSGAGSSGNWRIVVEAKAGPAGKIDFYGLDLANKYRCTLTFRLERGTGKRAAVLETRTLVEDVTGRLISSDGEEEDSTAMSRVAYEGALRRLTDILSFLPFFFRSGEDPPPHASENKPHSLERPTGATNRGDRAARVPGRSHTGRTEPGRRQP